MSQQLVKVLVLAAFIAYGAIARAETPDENPFDAPVIQAGGGGVDAANAGIVADSVGDVNSIPKVSTDNRGRREKLEEDAIPNGKAGVGAALAAGISLTAEGLPMVMSPDLFTKLRGLDLLAKAALEFAQAGATAGTNQANQKAANAVNKNADGPTGSQLQSPEDVKKEAAAAVKTPELQQALGQAGINSDDFIDQLTSGKLSSPEAVAAAAGVDISGATPEMMAKSSSENGKEELPSIVFADDTSNPTPTGSGASGDGRLASSSPNESKANEHDGAGVASASDLYSQAQSMAARTMDMAKKSGADMANFNEKDLIGKYLSALQKKNAKGGAFTASDLALYNQGIKRLRPKQNIFHVARTSYHGFGKWRGKRPARLAQAGPVRKIAAVK